MKILHSYHYCCHLRMHTYRPVQPTKPPASSVVYGSRLIFSATFTLFSAVPIHIDASCSLQIIHIFHSGFFSVMLYSIISALLSFVSSLNMCSHHKYQPSIFHCYLSAKVILIVLEKYKSCRLIIRLWDKTHCCLYRKLIALLS